MPHRPVWLLLALLLTSFAYAAEPAKPVPAAPVLPQVSATAPGTAAAGSLTYRARLVHNNRSAISYVSGRVDLGNGDFEEHVERSYMLDWKQLPGRMLPARPLLPSVWSVGGHSAQRLGETLPRFDSPLLRHFILGELIARPQNLRKDGQFLAGQLVINSVNFGEQTSFEVLASFRGAPLVLVGQRQLQDGVLAVRELAVLGPTSELYQYFFEQVDATPGPLSPAPQIPVLDLERYVSFPKDGSQPVAIMPVKDWLVFQASLPGGRPLNLVLDSGSEQMIVDDLVLKLDSRLVPSGQISISGPAGDAPMQLYEGFDFNVGGVEFKNLSVAGTALTQLGFGADVRIHGVVGNEILQLCQLDLDLEHGQLHLRQPGTAPAQALAASEPLPLTFIRELPHIEGSMRNGETALLLLDTGQRSPLSVNIDFLEHHKLGDELKMNGFLGDITGGLLPRYIVEELPFSLAGGTYNQKAVDASQDSTFSYAGVPVIGSIGFSLLAQHFGGVTFDYSRKLMWLRDAAQHRDFVGQPAAWGIADRVSSKPAEGAAVSSDPQAAAAAAGASVASSLRRNAAAAPEEMGLDPGGFRQSPRPRP
jgi:hypothetical protein